jgi:plastocyanin
MRRKATWGGCVAAAIAAAAVSCGKSDTGTNPTPTPTNTISITANGVTPKTIAVALGSQVTFINNDSRPHFMQSDPHPEHTDCPEINQVGVLNPGQSRQTGNLNTARNCGFHDHDNFENNSLKGTITIQ